MPTTITAARIGQRRMPNTMRPPDPRPTFDKSGGSAAITKITMPRNTIAPKVSTNALPRFLTNLGLVHLMGDVDPSDERRHPS